MRLSNKELKRLYPDRYEKLTKRYKARYQRLKTDETYKHRSKRRQKKYRQKHPFIRMAKGLKRKRPDCKITAFDLWCLTKKQKMICPLTGRRLTNDNISVDHIIHLSNGGKNEVENLRLVIKEVNLARHCLTDVELVELCRDVIKTAGDLT